MLRFTLFIIVLVMSVSSAFAGEVALVGTFELSEDALSVYKAQVTAFEESVTPEPVLVMVGIRPKEIKVIGRVIAPADIGLLDGKVVLFYGRTEIKHSRTVWTEVEIYWLPQDDGTSIRGAVGKLEHPWRDDGVIVWTETPEIRWSYFAGKLDFDAVRFIGSKFSQGDLDSMNGKRVLAWGRFRTIDEGQGRKDVIDEVCFRLLK